MDEVTFRGIKSDYEAKLKELRSLNRGLRETAAPDQRAFLDQLEQVFAKEGENVKKLTYDDARKKLAGRLEDAGTTLAATASLVAVAFDVYNGQAFKDTKSGAKTVVSLAKPLKDADAYIRVGQRVGKGLRLVDAGAKDFKAAEVWSFAAKDIEAASKATKGAKIAGRLKVLGPVADFSLAGIEGYNAYQAWDDGDEVGAVLSGGKAVLNFTSGVGNTMVLTGYLAPVGAVVVLVSQVGLIVLEVADMGRELWKDATTPALARSLGVDLSQPRGPEDKNAEGELELGRPDPEKEQARVKALQAKRRADAQVRLKKLEDKAKLDAAAAAAAAAKK
jgi:hypothetical protein